MKLRIRVNKSKDDMYVLQSNHIPRYKEFLELDNHRFVVDYVVYNCDIVYQDMITDVIIYVTEIY